MSVSTDPKDIENSRFAIAPYQYRSQLAHRRFSPHLGLPLAWGTVLIAVPLFWLTAIAWFTRMVF
ncbi:hypothetical protein [Pacificoceanicola onchidii]|uniref:hypothetical protein n=1 Tax=Pacificoceanicola onchidii TaxID=2562685 RepID=UPI0010A41563|nr:hypothetical protein [Pacificoceanicola onchidii]